MRKQRHTIGRIVQQLTADHDFEHASYSTIRDYVRKRRGQMELEVRQGRLHLEGTVPQGKRPGEEAEFDFADVGVDLAGQRRKCVPFTLRKSYSSKAVHRLFATASQDPERHRSLLLPGHRSRTSVQHVVIAAARLVHRPLAGPGAGR